jgi:hypothetical protein
MGSKASDNEKLGTAIKHSRDAEPEAADHELSAEQLAELLARLRHPGPMASIERVAAILAKFRV